MIAIIDLDSLIFHAFHPNKVLDEFGIPLRTEDNKRFIYKDKIESEIEESCDYLMNTLLEKSGAEYYIGYIKGKDTIKNRISINPEYKSNRNLEQPKYWEFTKNYLVNNWNANVVNNIEVDDAVVITNTKLKESFICAIDSDLLGIEGTHYNWKKNQWIEVSKEEANYKFWSDMICGTHNCTKGIPGKGKAFVDRFLPGHNIFYLKVLMEFVTHFGEYKGIKEFYKNYISNYLLREDNTFIIPDLNKVDRNVKLIYE